MAREYLWVEGPAGPLEVTGRGMSYLELVQRLWLECGLAGVGPSTLAGASPMARRLAIWVAQAWLDLQSARDWPFLRRTLNFNTVPGQRDYGLHELGATSFRRVDESYGRIGGSALGWIDRQLWRDCYADSTQQGRPILATIDTLSGQIRFSAIPDQAYPVAIEYFTQAQALTDDHDVPYGLNPQDHILIVGMALRQYGLHDSVPEAVMRGDQIVSSKYADLVGVTAGIGAFGFAASPLA